MGLRNVLVEGVSGTGKTAVCHELRRRGHHAINGDRELAYQGDPETGEARDDVTGLAVHDHHLWRADEVRAMALDHSHPVTFFCGGSRNVAAFADVFDAIVVLTVDAATLARRLDERPADEWGGHGRTRERELIERLHRTQEDVPATGVRIDAGAPLAVVVDEILRVTLG
ncbi:nucleoside kinase [Serinibacter arcticus]|uniref:Nucleoside kinase n=1 Tax=Serinibacter arcticus TaxID=1655435 RepID=A0A2U1ZWX8_9MICO|nr:AAA family ATPase [Serinibacter arcticus]PWD51481.1 nucleoside kinase [Serinibacter arcticus]